MAKENTKAGTHEPPPVGNGNPIVPLVQQDIAARVDALFVPFSDWGELDKPLGMVTTAHLLRERLRIYIAARLSVSFPIWGLLKGKRP